MMWQPEALTWLLEGGSRSFLQRGDIFRENGVRTTALHLDNIPEADVTARLKCHLIQKSNQPPEFTGSQRF